MKENAVTVDKEFANDRISDLHRLVVVENNLLLEDAKIPNESDEHFYKRYLISNSWDIESSFEHIQQTIEWRQSEKVTQLGHNENPNTILSRHGSEMALGSNGNENIEDEILRKFPMSYLRNNDCIFRDTMGRPIFWYKIGAMDVAGLLETADLEDLFRYFIWRFEQMVRILGDGLRTITESDDDEGESNRPGSVVGKWVILMDMEGFSMFTHFNRTTLDVVTRLNNLGSSYYPETLAKLVVINCPYVFKSAWAVINPLINPQTQAKISISRYCPNVHSSVLEDIRLIEYYEASKKIASSSMIL